MAPLGQRLPRVSLRVRSVVIHFGLVTVAYLGAFLLRFDFDVTEPAFARLLQTLPLLIVMRLLVFARFQLFRGMWLYVGMRDFTAIVQAVSLSSVLFAAVVITMLGRPFPNSILVIDWVLCVAVLAGTRYLSRAFHERHARVRRGGRRALIVGAGNAGESLLRDIQRSRTLGYDVRGFIDDDPRKQRARVHGIEVLGTVDDLQAVCRANGIEELLIAIPSAHSDDATRVIQRCRAIGLPFKSVPALADLLQGTARISQLRPVEPEQLLGRDAVRLDVERLEDELRGKRVLVTGAGGSIGSELSRQLTRFEPAAILLLDRAESNLYAIELELRRLHPALDIVTVVADIMDRPLLTEAFGSFRPDVVYHAAAYKHVPLMEAQPLEAITNNIFGTERVISAALACAAKKLVLISTDKAVSAVGIMGMTKRIAEAVVEAHNGGGAVLVAVRFGNVLGSDGSVFPLFRRQIAEGGPVTLTDPEVTRYFMLLSEAAQLVLQAGAIGKGGEIFFLDMGDPIRIADMARTMIALSGLEPDRDIEIRVTGLRPGERLNESLVNEGEELFSTQHEKVFMVHRPPFDAEDFLEDLDELRRLTRARECAAAVKQLKIMVARY